jgi:hypothetical protein
MGQAAMNRLKASGIGFCANSAAAVQAIWDAGNEDNRKFTFDPSHQYRDSTNMTPETEAYADTFYSVFYTGDPSHVDSVRVDSIKVYGGMFNGGQTSSGMGMVNEGMSHEGNHAINPLVNSDTSGTYGGAIQVGKACRSAVDSTPPVTTGGAQLRRPFSTTSLTNGRAR